MSRLSIFFSIATSLFSCGAVGDGVPIIEDVLLYKPTFQLREGKEHEAGTAFAIFFRDNQYLITAHHLFGKPGGFERQMSAAEIEADIVAVKLRNLKSGKEELAGQYIRIDEAAPISLDNGAFKDIAVFHGNNTNGGLALSPAKVKRGQRVWLISKSKDLNDSSLLHEAEIIYLTEKFTLYRFFDAGINLRATSGAPVIDSNGDVVAINTASIVVPYVLKIGVGGPITFLSSKLTELDIS